MSDGRRDAIDPGVVKGQPTTAEIDTTNVCKFHPIISELIHEGIEILVRKKTFVIAGFYKLGTIQIRCSLNDPTLTAVDEYGAETPIREVRDLVDLNFDWWQTCKTRGNPSWENPNEMWAPLLIKHGFVTKRTVEVYEPVK